MTNIVIVGTVQRDYALRLISALDLSKKWAVTVKKYVKPRSNSQNALFHKWCSVIADEVGDDIESVKHDLKCMFLGTSEHVSKITGEITQRPKHTSDLNTAEFADLMNKIEAFANSQLGIALPSPLDLIERM